MKIIKELSEMISEEIDDAEKYIRHAIECKDTDRQLANTFAELSNQEMNHMNTLHGEVARIIQEYKDKNGDPPKEMTAVYEYLHKKQIDHAAEVKAMQAMYKGM